MTHSAAPRRGSSSSSSSSAPLPSSSEDDIRAGAILGKALVRAASRLGLTSQKELAEVLGVSPPTVSRLLKGARPLDPESNEGQRATLFLRIWRSLDALVGGDERAASEWFRAANHHLGAPPVELARTITGLVHVADYLDAMRGKV